MQEENASKTREEAKLYLEENIAACLDEAQAFLEQKIGNRAIEIGLTLGSGLGTLAHEIEDAVVVPYADVPYLQPSTSPTHVGQFVIGRLAGKNVIAMQGRLHAYEGYSSFEIAFPIWLMGRLGVKTLVTSNASGAINESYHVGDFCIMTDQINLMGRNPVFNPLASQVACRYFSMTDCFDPELRKLAKKIAIDQGVSYQEGVYLGLLGCCFETPAEIRAYRAWGADLVGMSTVEEVIAARQIDLRILGISMCSNMAAGVGAIEGVGGASPSSEEISDTAKKVERDFSRLIRGIVAAL